MWKSTIKLYKKYNLTLDAQLDEIHMTNSPWLCMKDIEIHLSDMYFMNVWVCNKLNFCVKSESY